MATLDAFVRVVSVSRGLSVQERQDLLEHAEEFSAEYRKHVIALLRKFDAHGIARERILRDRLNNTLVNFEQDLVREGVDEVAREELLRKAREQCNRFFTPSSVDG